MMVEMAPGNNFAENPTRPYTERNGIGAAEYIDCLLAEPEIVLDEEQLATVRAFSHGLFNGNLGERTCASQLSLEQINSMDTVSVSQTFVFDYLRTPKASQFAEILGVDPESSDEEMSAVLSDIENPRQVDPILRKKIAIEGATWRKQQVADLLLEDPTYDADYQRPAAVAIKRDPQKLLDKIQNLQDYRAFYRDIHRDLKKLEETDATKAMTTVLQVHVARVNSLMALLYRPATSLANQLDRMSESDQRTAWERALKHAIPYISAAQSNEQLSRRTDRVANGVAVDEQQSFTPFSPELLAYAEMVTERGAGATELTAELDAETIAKMDETIWDHTDLQAFLSDVLTEWGLLSEHDNSWDEIDKRDGPAPDGKWQVVITPKTKNLIVDGIKKIMLIPDEFLRSLTQIASPTGALPVAAHELAHVLQNEYDAMMGDQLPLARIKGSRAVTLREGGGMYQEQAVQAMLGREAPTNFHYLRAAQAKEAGGTILQAARAFYDSARAGKMLSEKQDAALRLLAADRTTRLYRNGGYDTQPLDYAEQGILIEALAKLPEATRSAIIIAGSSFSFRDAAALHRVGLFNIPRGEVPNPATTVMQLYLERYRDVRPSGGAITDL